MTTIKVLTYNEVLDELLKTDLRGNYFDPLIGPTENVIEFAWHDWSLWVLPDGTWKAVKNVEAR